jgi:hypothetical protein
MAVLTAAEVSRLASIAANPERAKSTNAVGQLHGHAKSVAEVLIGEDEEADPRAKKTAKAIRSWLSRQG